MYNFKNENNQFFKLLYFKMDSEKKLSIYKNKLIHFLCCEVKKIEFYDKFNFENCITLLDK